MHIKQAGEQITALHVEYTRIPAKVFSNILDSLVFYLEIEMGMNFAPLEVYNVTVVEDHHKYLSRN
ncbi:MAG TPA: hypothetical protein VED17_07305 [Nitrososphaerales archaeon]|nr:hypothetical protein [Nitrososphaerales archaeon]